MARFTRSARIAGAAVGLCALGAAASASELYISANVPQVDVALAGGTFNDDDVILTNPSGSTASFFFDSGNDTNAFHIRPDGKYLTSALFNFTLGGTAWGDDDIVLYDPATDTATEILDGASTFDATSEDISGVSMLPDGRILYSTLSEAVVVQPGPNLTINAGDIVVFDTTTGLHETFLPGAQIWDDGTDTNGLHYLPNGNFLLTGNADSAINGVPYNEGDIIEFDPTTRAFSVFFAESNFTNSTTTNYELDAVYFIPSPAAAALLGLAGLASTRRRR